jgi:hypothetical protein
MKLMEAAQNGFRRLQYFRANRFMFLRSFVGQYYDADHGEIGTEPLNQIFSAIAVIVPNLVSSFPKHVVTSNWMAYRQYGELLGMALDKQAKAMRLPDILRRWIVDALFTLGILKTGLCDSNSVVHFDTDEATDPGSVYTSLVDLDDFTFDPTTSEIEAGLFMGHRIRGVSRVQLLDSGLYRNDLVERLPRAGTQLDEGSRELSKGKLTHDQISNLDDEVDITELWVPAAQALVAMPGIDMTADDFLRVSDYYGPDTGPFTLLRLTPPVPNNPMPLAAVGVWHDLHVLGNRMAKKIIDQAIRQKDVLGYRRANADDAQEIVDAHDGDAVAMDDPTSVATYSFGGQQRSNEAHMDQLQMWFNYVSGNVEALGGIREASGSATQANILQQNGSVRLNDLNDLVYAATGAEARRRAWYLHTDPLLEVPLIRRQQMPAVVQNGMIAQPAQMVEQQVLLTPEARRGDFLDYAFEIEQKSMSRLDPAQRLQRCLEFAIKVVPAAASAAQTCMMMGVPFGFQAYVVLMAKELGIEWLDEVFQDPTFQMAQAQTMMRAPGMQGSKGQAGGMPAIQQNGQPGNVAAVEPTGLPAQAQQGANEGQAGLGVRPSY